MKLFIDDAIYCGLSKQQTAIILIYYVAHCYLCHANRMLLMSVLKYCTRSRECTIECVTRHVVHSTRAFAYFCHDGPIVQQRALIVFP